MGLRDWLGFETRAAEDEGVIVIPAREASTRAVSTQEALSLSMVYRAVQILAVSAKQLSIQTYRNDEAIQSPAFVRQPDLDMPLSAFIELTVISLATQGNAYWLVDTDGSGRPTNLQVLNPLFVDVKVSEWGNVLAYSYKNKTFTPDRIKHLKLMRVPGQTKGLGPIQANQTGLRGALDTRDYSANWFDTSGIPAGGYLSTDLALNSTQSKEYRDAWTQATSDRSGVPIVGNGLQFNSMFLSPRDAMWLEAQQFQITDIARLFGVPSSLMLAQVEGSSQTYQNVSQDWLGYTRFTLLGYLQEIEDAFSSLLPRGTSAKFNVEALLRSDTTTRYEAHAVAIAAGFMTVAEVREIENLAPLTTSETPTEEAPADV